MSLKKEDIELMLEAIEDKINSHATKLRELETVKSNLTSQLKKLKNLTLFDQQAEVGSTAGRLSNGLPEKWIMEIFERDRVHSIMSLRSAIMKAKGRALNDSTTRRVVSELVSHGKLKKNDDGTWEIC